MKKSFQKSVHPAAALYNLKVGGEGTSLEMQKKKRRNLHDLSEEF